MRTKITLASIAAFAWPVANAGYFDADFTGISDVDSLSGSEFITDESRITTSSMNNILKALKYLKENSSGGKLNSDTVNNLIELGEKSDGSTRDAGTAFVITDDGKVGIGTDSPVTRLDVAGTFRAKGAIVSEKSGAGAWTAGEIDMRDSDNGFRWLLSNRGENKERNFFYLSSYNGTTWADPLKISPNGGLILTNDQPDDQWPGQLIVASKTADGSKKVRINLNEGGDVLSQIESKRDGGQYKGYLAFRTRDGTMQEHLRINKSGNVGIGTTTPTEKLEVNGNVKATAFIGDGSQLTGISAGGALTGTDDLNDDSTADDAGFELTTKADGSTERDAGTAFVVTDDGKVGIGTTTPTQKLDVSGAVRALGPLVSELPGEGQWNSGAVELKDADNGFRWIMANRGENGNRNSLIFTKSNDWTAPLVISSNGVVNIDKDIDGSQSDYAAQLEVTSPSRGLGYVSRINFNEGSDVFSQIESAREDAQYTGYLALKTRNGSLNESMRINKFGNVGIGTTSPTTKLDVDGKIRVQSNALGTCDATNEGAIAYESDATKGDFKGCVKISADTYEWRSLTGVVN